MHHRIGEWKHERENLRMTDWWSWPAAHDSVLIFYHLCLSTTLSWSLCHRFHRLTMNVFEMYRWENKGNIGKFGWKKGYEVRKSVTWSALVTMWGRTRRTSSWDNKNIITNTMQHEPNSMPKSTHYCNETLLSLQTLLLVSYYFFHCLWLHSCPGFSPRLLRIISPFSPQCAKKGIGILESGCLGTLISLHGLWKDPDSAWKGDSKGNLCDMAWHVSKVQSPG